MDCGLKDLNWLYLRQFLHELERDFDQKRAYLAYLATRWVTGYEMLRSYQDAVIYQSTPSEFEMTYFKACAAQLKGKGLHLLALLQQNPGMDLDRSVGFGADDVMAIVQEIEISAGVVYSAMTPTRRNRLDSLLNASS